MERVAPVEVARDEDGLVLLFTLGDERFATHLRVTRQEEDRGDFGPEPPLLTRIGNDCGATLLRLQVNLTVDDGRTMHACHGEAAFRAALRSDPARWKRHMLGGVEAREWLARAGHLSGLRIRVEGGWPYAEVDGEPIRFPKGEWLRRDNPPVDPGELCRSVAANDECWLFTCECSEPACGAIDSGILVAHDQGLVVWRCPEFPEVPLAVFDQRAYRKAALTAVKVLLREPPHCSGLNWTMGIRPQQLRKALAAARACRSWS
jgi:hypothetical protein